MKFKIHTLFFSKFVVFLLLFASVEVQTKESVQWIDIPNLVGQIQDYETIRRNVEIKDFSLYERNHFNHSSLFNKVIYSINHTFQLNNSVLNITTRLYSHHQEAKQLFSPDQIFLTTPKTPKYDSIPNLGEESLYTSNDLFMLRNNVIFQLSGNKEILMSIANHIDQSIVNHEPQVIFGQPKVPIHTGQKLTLKTGETKPLDFEFLKDQKTNDFDVKTLHKPGQSFGQVNRLKDQPGSFEYKAEKRPSDLVKMVFVLEGEKIAAATCEIVIQRSEEEKQLIEKVVRKIKTDDYFQWEIITLMRQIRSIIDKDDRELAPIFHSLLTPETPFRIKKNALNILNEIQAPETYPIILELLENNKNKTAMHMTYDTANLLRVLISTINNYSNPSAIPALQEIVSNKNLHPSLREIARESIEAINNK